jgi:hypothetical protein
VTVSIEVLSGLNSKAPAAILVTTAQQRILLTPVAHWNRALNFGRCRITSMRYC